MERKKGGLKSDNRWTPSRRQPTPFCRFACLDARLAVIRASPCFPVRTRLGRLVEPGEHEVRDVLEQGDEPSLDTWAQKFSC